MKQKVLKVSKRQSGISKSPAMDKQVKAMKPGQRQSSKGKKYWETRKNRSDKDPKKRY